MQPSGVAGFVRGRRLVIRPIASVAVGSAILIAIAMLLIFGLLPAALVAAGS